MNIIHKILGIVLAGFVLATAQGFGASPTNVTNDANSTIHAGGGTPIGVQLGYPDRASSVPNPAIGSTAVYNTLNSWFVVGGAMDQPGIRHFNFDPMYKPPAPPPYWQQSHTQVASPFAAKLSAGQDVRVYFVDNQAGYNNALGITGATAATTKLVFPFIANTQNSAAGNSSTFGGSGAGRSNSANAGCLELSDMVDYTLTQSGTINLDLLSNVNGTTGAVNGPIWNTDPLLSSQDTSDQHFHFYLIPELALADPTDFGGRANYLVGVEDLPFGSSDKDFNDLLFIVSLPVPEPRIYILVGSLLALALMVARRERKDVA